MGLSAALNKKPIFCFRTMSGFQFVAFLRQLESVESLSSFYHNRMTVSSKKDFATDRQLFVFMAS